jgi:hypothetical protein
VSDIVRVNRNEGLAFGGGLTHRFGDGFSALGRVRYGTADHGFKETAELTWQRANGAGLTVRAYDDFRDAGDQPEVSGARNTLAAQEFGSDFTDYYRVRGFAIVGDAGIAFGTRWRISAAREEQRALTAVATPSTGRYTAAFPAAALSALRIGVDGFHAASGGPFGTTVQGTLSILAERFRGDGEPTDHWFGRAAATASVDRAVGNDRLVFTTFAGFVTGAHVPAQSLVFVGGPVTGPGFDFHQFASTSAVSERIEWRHPVASVPVSIGRFGRLGMPISLVPFGQLFWIDAGQPNQATRGWNGALGVGVLTVFDLLRIDVARGIRGGRWTFSVDVTRDLWRIL